MRVQFDDLMRACVIKGPMKGNKEDGPSYHVKPGLALAKV